MRTTLDLPDPLMRELKARAAMEGIKLKDYFARMVEAALQRSSLGASDAQRSPVPVFKRKGAKPMPAMTNAELNTALETQDTDKIIRGG